MAQVSGENERIWASFGDKSKNWVRKMSLPPSEQRLEGTGAATPGFPLQPRMGSTVLLDPGKVGTPCGPRTPSPAPLYMGQWRKAQWLRIRLQHPVQSPSKHLPKEQVWQHCAMGKLRHGLLMESLC